MFRRFETKLTKLKKITEDEVIDKLEPLDSSASEEVSEEVSEGASEEVTKEAR